MQALVAGDGQRRVVRRQHIRKLEITMRAFPEKQNHPERRPSLNLTRPSASVSAASYQASSILHVQHTMRAQAGQRVLHANAGGFEAGFAPTVSPRFGHDFSRISVHPRASATIQPKLTVNTPGDIYEQEADRVADQVMRMPEPQQHRDCAWCQSQTEHLAQEKEHWQPKRTRDNESGDNVAPPIVDEVLRSPGQPLDPATRDFMETRFGHDFSLVRVHTNAKAVESTRAVNAQAYTVGQDIAFGEGQYTPQTLQGRRLLAHELAHVVQQKGASVIWRQQDMSEEEEEDEEQHMAMLMRTSNQAFPDTTSLVQNQASSAKEAGTIQTRRLASPDTPVVQRAGPAAAAALTAGEWIGLGAAGYAVAQDAVKGTAGDMSYTFDEMEGVLLPGGGNDVAAYRTAHPNADIRSATHIVAVWQGTSGSRKAGIKFGISFNYDGHAIGNISCDILDAYDWPLWSGSVGVNFTPLSLARGDVSVIRITLNVNADRTLAGGRVRSRVLELDATSYMQTVSGQAFVRFNE